MWGKIVVQTGVQDLATCLYLGNWMLITECFNHQKIEWIQESFVDAIFEE
jgi:hypothetical protein